MIDVCETDGRKREGRRKEEENIDRARVKLSFVGTNTPRDRINAITRLNAAQEG